MRVLDVLAECAVARLPPLVRARPLPGHRSRAELVDCRRPQLPATGSAPAQKVRFRGLRGLAARHAAKAVEAPGGMQSDHRDDCRDDAGDEQRRLEPRTDAQPGADSGEAARVDEPAGEAGEDDPERSGVALLPRERRRERAVDDLRAVAHERYGGDGCGGDDCECGDRGRAPRHNCEEDEDPSGRRNGAAARRREVDQRGECRQGCEREPAEKRVPRHERGAKQQRNTERDHDGEPVPVADGKAQPPHGS